MSTTNQQLPSSSHHRIRRYWIVSPNVKFNEKTVGKWRESSVRERAAFMGWGPHDHSRGKIGPKFAGQIQSGVISGDVIMIARRHKKEPEIVGFGLVRGKYATRLKGFTPPQEFGSARRLSPFKAWSRAPSFLADVLHYTRALVQLHPERSHAHRKLCEWMDRQLGSKGRESEEGHLAATESRRRQYPAAQQTALVDLPANHQLDYKVQTKNKVIRAKKIEAKLLESYRTWVREQGRKLSAARFKMLRCDAYEAQRRNLIEAKSSSRREHIRMAVGQLLDYAYQGRKKLGDSNKAILLPKKPDLSIEEWLQDLGISIVWREKGAFLDNADGQFS